MPVADLPCCKSSRLVEPDFCRLVSHCLSDKVLNAEPTNSILWVWRCFFGGLGNLTDGDVVMLI